MTTAKMSAERKAVFLAGLTAPVWVSAIFIVLAAPIILIRAFVLTKLWQWYVVPDFELPPLRMAVAFGLSVLCSVLLPRDRNSTDTNPFWRAFLTSASFYLIDLVLGWLGTFFL